MSGQGSITFHDVFDNEHDHEIAQMRLEGVYIWPFQRLRMVANRYQFVLAPFVYPSMLFLFVYFNVMQYIGLFMMIFDLYV